MKAFAKEQAEKCRANADMWEPHSAGWAYEMKWAAYWEAFAA